ncbi:mitochondrial antiviral-signaling protein [Polymixia lowei]
MSYIGDKLYNNYIRKNLAVIASNVRMQEIIAHLSCLTQSDRELIEAKKDNSGNYIAMMLLLDCLRKRESWPEEFITALEACEQFKIAAEIKAEYNSLKVHNNPNPPSPPSTVVMAHVHPTPSANQPLSALEDAGHSQAAIGSPPLAPAPPVSPAPEASVQPEEPPSPAPQPNKKTASSPEPAPETSSSPQARVVPPPSTPPPPPEAPHRQATTPATPQRGSPPHQQPEENCEADIQGASVLQEPGPPVKRCETAAPSVPDAIQTTTVLEVSTSQSPSSSQTDSETVVSACYMKTPEKLPVQDTAPLEHKVVTGIQQPEEYSEPTSTKVTENRRHSKTMGTPSPQLAGTDGPNPPLCDEDVCLSKPGPLCSIQQNNVSPTTSALNAETAPYSGNSDRLEESDPAPDSESTSQVSVVPACSGVAPGPSPPPCQENGIVKEPALLSYSEPEENHYESLCQSSLGEVLENVVHVVGEPSIQNQDGQTPSMLGNVLDASKNPPVQNNDSRPEIVIQSPSSVSPDSSCHSCEDDQTEEALESEAGLQAQIRNGQPTSALSKESSSAPPTAAAVTGSIFNAPSGENFHPAESGAVEFTPGLKAEDQQDAKEEMPSSNTPSNTKYFLTAAGVGACALLVAWRLKN